MVRLQPGFRRKKEEEAPADRKREPEEGMPEPEHHEEKGYSNRNLILGVAAAIAVIIIIAVVWAYYPSAPPGPANAVSDSQVISELQRLREMSAHPANLDINPADYPKAFGAWNNRTLVEQYYCSDVCPDYGRVDLVFQGVTNEQCAQAGGRSLHDLAFGGYIGCEPKVQ